MTDGQFLLPGRLDAADLTGSTTYDDWAPGGVTGIGQSTAIYVKATGAGARITSINAEAFTGGGNKARRLLIIVNDGATHAIALEGSAATGTARNKLGWTGDYDLQPGELVVLLYDGGDLLWRGAARSDLGGGGSSLPVSDSTSVIEGSADATKEGRFEVDTNVPTGTVVVLTFPAADGTIATLALTETLTNKTIDGGTLEGCSVVTDGSFQGFYDQNGNGVLQMIGIASAVNRFAFANSATGNACIMRPLGSDTNIDAIVTGTGNDAVVQTGVYNRAITLAHAHTANHVTTNEGALQYRTDLDEFFYYDSSRSKWLSVSKQFFMFGHSAEISSRLRVIGLSNDSDAEYELAYDYTIVGYSYSRADSDSVTIDVNVNASTNKVSISSSATRGSSTTTNVDCSSGDELWAEISSGSANIRTLVVEVRRRAT